MIDFYKHTKKKPHHTPLNPKQIYDSLDRASDKGPLRPAQQRIIDQWSAKYHDQKDAILKLHTGEGKTLLGLLFLQSKLNETHEPAVYLCPNHHLVNQTCTQAYQFGFKYCTIVDDIPEDFCDGKSILITTVQSLFNGKTKFGLGPRSSHVGSIVVDDAHACVPAIKQSFS